MGMELTEWLVRVTRNGVLRGLLVLCARYSVHIRLWLWSLDVYAVATSERPPGLHILPWGDISSEQMADIVIERLRRAHRPMGITAYRIKVGECDATQPTGELEGAWDGNAMAIRRFFDDQQYRCPLSPTRIVRLLLVGELAEATARRYGWK
jgi:hypothetical protein